MQTFEWPIDEFAKRTTDVDKLESPTFQLFGHTWCITLYPRGQCNGEIIPNDNVSVFLRWCHSATQTVEPLIRFSICFVDSENMFYRTQAGLHRFTQDDFDWGWHSFTYRSALKSDQQHLIIRVILSDDVNVDTDPDIGSLEIAGLGLNTTDQPDMTFTIDGLDYHCHSSVMSQFSLHTELPAEISAETFELILAYIYQDRLKLDHNQLFDLVVGANRLGIDVASKRRINAITATTLLNTTFHTQDFQLKKKCMDAIIPGASGAYDHMLLKHHIKFCSLIDIIKESINRSRAGTSPTSWKFFMNYLIGFAVEWAAIGDADCETYMKVLVATTDIHKITFYSDMMSVLNNQYRHDPRFDRVTDCASKLSELISKKLNQRR